MMEEGADDARNKHRIREPYPWQKGRNRMKLGKSVAGWIGMLCLMVVFSVGSVWAESSKIGIVDFQKILELSNAGKAAQNEINAQGKLMENELKEKGKEIEELEKRLERESLVMSREMREEKQRDLRIKVGDYKALQQKYMEDFKLLEGRVINRIQKEVVGIIQDYGKKENFLMIVEKRSGGVVYAQSTIDITDTIIQLYNDMPSSAKTEAAPETKPKDTKKKP